MKCKICDSNITEYTHQANNGYCMICVPKPCVICGTTTNNRYNCSKCLKIAELEKALAIKQSQAQREIALVAISDTDFENDLTTWINCSMHHAPSTLVGIVFNLNDNAGEFSIELVGTNKFSKKNSDWATYEAYRPTIQYVILPKIAVSDNWEKCIEVVRGIILKYLHDDGPGAKILKSKKGVALGFVDGDLTLLYQGST